MDIDEYNFPPDPPESPLQVVISFIVACILIGLVFLKGCG